MTGRERSRRARVQDVTVFVSQYSPKKNPGEHVIYRTDEQFTSISDCPSTLLVAFGRRGEPVSQIKVFR